MLARRAFLQSSSLLALAPAVPLFVARTARAAPTDRDGRVLVVVQLDGGNDALNTVVPHADPNYAKLRPTLKIRKRDLVRMSDTLALHPSLKPLDKLLQDGQLAVIPGVGYPNPNRSHFESTAIWHTARFDPEEHRGYGWLGRALDPGARTSYALCDSVPGALRGRRSTALTLGRLEEMLLAEPDALKHDATSNNPDDLLAFVRRQAVDARTAAKQLAQVAGGSDAARYPSTGLAERLNQTARLLKSNLGAGSSTPHRAASIRTPPSGTRIASCSRSLRARWPRFSRTSRQQSSPNAWPCWRSASLAGRSGRTARAARITGRRAWCSSPAPA